MSATENQKNVQRKMSREQKIQQQKNMDLPVNRFLNSRNEDGTRKYASADKLMPYFVNNPDPVMDQIRMCNALAHELRFHQVQAKLYLDVSKAGGGMLKNEHGLPMSAEECYVKHIAEKHTQHLVMSRIRQQICHKLLAMCDGSLFTFEQYDVYVLEMEKVVKEMGFELFPDSVDVIHPL